ncbi:MAG: peptidoglycan bridge formation protein FemAB [Coriobacteriales bacterium]|nr:peptidoglycan bridge formation protein FemAB [Coriobacteriales bacterium]
MLAVRKISWGEHAAIAQAHNAQVPIEQTEVWASFQQEIDGREPWLPLVVEDAERALALVLFIEFTTHGYHYVRSAHGPLWLCDKDEELERELVLALRDYVHARPGAQVFMRMAVDNELDVTEPVLSTVPYDATVVIDITGGEDDILSRMKPRGRRDVRKSVREAPITCADETEQAMESFAPYYEVMCETSSRDGFVPAPIEDYERMIRMLGRDHVRVYAGRLEDGTVCTWSLCTLQGNRATRYYAASLSNTMRLHVTDRLCFFECCELGKLGYEEYDLMGIGSDFSPSLKGLNEFKTKFCKQTQRVAPDRDVPVRKGRYALLCKAKDLKNKLKKD